MDLFGNDKNKITGKKYQPVMSVTGLNDQGLSCKNLFSNFKLWTPTTEYDMVYCPLMMFDHRITSFLNSQRRMASFILWHFMFSLSQITIFLLLLDDVLQCQIQDSVEKFKNPPIASSIRICQKKMLLTKNNYLDFYWLRYTYNLDD